jgi:hypothetical protein
VGWQSISILHERWEIARKEPWLFLGASDAARDKIANISGPATEFSAKCKEEGVSNWLDSLNHR